MADYVIGGILLLVLLLAVFRVKKHFKSGGCCGSGSNTIRDKKNLKGAKIGEKKLLIDGMHCENCEIRIENALNRLDGVAAKVSCKRKTAFVAYSSEVADALLKATVEQLGYRVAEIRNGK